jgi:hypothetical protein
VREKAGGQGDVSRGARKRGEAGAHTVRGREGERERERKERDKRAQRREADRKSH